MQKFICFFNGQRYIGDAVYINGYNGYTKTEHDSKLCAVINNSAFGSNGPNLLTDENGNHFHSEDHRGMAFEIRALNNIF